VLLGFVFRLVLLKLLSNFKSEICGDLQTRKKPLDFGKLTFICNIFLLVVGWILCVLHWLLWSDFM